MDQKPQQQQQQQGLSRAAKKRKRARQKTKGVVVPLESTSSVDRIPSTKTTTNISTKQSSSLIENKNRDVLHPESNIFNDDEELPMKKPAQVKPDVPSHVHNIQQLLNYSINGNDNDTTNPASSSSNDDNDDDDPPFTTRQLAYCILQFLLAPANVSVAAFYKQYWEQRPLHIPAAAKITKDNKTEKEQNSHHRWDGLWSIAEIQTLIQEKSNNRKTPLYYSQDLTVTKYTDGKRITFQPSNNKDSNSKNPQPVQSKQLVWNEYYEKEHCSIRFLCPHQFSKPIHRLLSILEHEFGCMVGANAYLTPPSSSQGFAPHYDDIEAFVMQLEGKKRWRVYAPKDDRTTLPRTSSHDFSPSDLDPPVLDIILEPGDVLYMPRGWIHQANTPSTTTTTSTTSNMSHTPEPSLHLTVSAYQQWTWTDFLEIVLPDALEAASMQTVALRQGLPPRFLEYMGIMHDNRQVPEAFKIAMMNNQQNDDRNGEQDDYNDDDNVDQETKQLQEEFRKKAKAQIWKVAKEAIQMIDSACDQMGKRFLSDRLPPLFLNTEQRNKTIASDHHRSGGGGGRGGSDKVLLPTHLVRLIRPGIARLVLENDMAVVYHCLDNSVIFHEKPLSPLEFEMDDAPAIEQLLTTIEPHWIAIADLFHDSIEDKVGVTQALYDEGILTVRETQ
jgi:lysine-specific demethylase/histidyl-hydroxylase NO66